jgi:carboxypeptidase C (cathepsin A)
MRLALALFGVALCGSYATASSAALSPSDFEVTDLPLLQGKANFKHYAGYMPATNGTKLFFWFCESQRSPQNDPVLFWTK